MRGTGLSSLLIQVRQHNARPGAGIHPCCSGLQVQGTAISPTSAALPHTEVWNKAGIYYTASGRIYQQDFSRPFPIGGSAPALAQKGAPGPSVRGRPPSLDVHMVVDMLHAVAVVAVAFGAVAELHVGVVRVGDAAHGALVEIALPVLDFLLSLFEVDGLRIDPVSSPAAPSGGGWPIRSSQKKMK